MCMLGLRSTADAIRTRLSLTQLQLPLHRHQGLSHMMSHLDWHPLGFEPPALSMGFEQPALSMQLELNITNSNMQLSAKKALPGR